MWKMTVDEPRKSPDSRVSFKLVGAKPFDAVEDRCVGGDSMTKFHMHIVDLESNSIRFSVDGEVYEIHTS